ncbi:hypothetical protein [Kribbella pittospori]|uniref:hypothetical protein n=1 Tax=Kribbella pittospori TaxID=722689 RepID=UPI0013F4BBCA
MVVPQRECASRSGRSATVTGQPNPTLIASPLSQAERVVDEGRLYQLIRQQGEVRERTIEVTFHAPGAAASAFTFG